MKKIISFGLIMMLAIQFAKAQQIEFPKKVIDYGTIKKGSEPERELSFINTGTAPLTITSAKGSCGCLVPTWPKEPIMPGETAKIKVRYDTKRVGAFTKIVFMTTNSIDNPEIQIQVIGNVEPGEDAVPGGQK